MGNLHDGLINIRNTSFLPSFKVIPLAWGHWHLPPTAGGLLCQPRSWGCPQSKQPGRESTPHLRALDSGLMGSFLRGGQRTKALRPSSSGQVLLSFSQPCLGRSCVLDILFSEGGSRQCSELFWNFIKGEIGESQKWGSLLSSCVCPLSPEIQFFPVLLFTVKPKGVFELFRSITDCVPKSKTHLIK